MADDLLPCPFCGGEAAKWPVAGQWVVGCQNLRPKCRFTPRCVEDDMGEAIAAWNTRTPQPDAVRGRDAALVEAVRLAAETFDGYAQLHRAKGTPDGGDKARENAALAVKMRKALSTTPSPTPARDGGNEA